MLKGREKYTLGSRHNEKRSENETKTRELNAFI
jgi:hypothetical protein